jgi:hypothetical protein
MILIRIVIISKKLSSSIYYDVYLPAVPRAGDYVLESENRDLGLKVESVFISPLRVTVRVKEEEDGDCDFIGLEKSGWKKIP